MLDVDLGIKNEETDDEKGIFFKKYGQNIKLAKKLY